jgi:hypothetical protein
MTTSSAHLLIIRFFDGVEKNVFQKDNFERIVEILQKLLYNTRPLGPLQPCQYYSTRSASSSHKISGSAVKAILTDFYCKILLFRGTTSSFSLYVNNLVLYTIFNLCITNVIVSFLFWSKFLNQR